jgi:hypothetical protein
LGSVALTGLGGGSAEATYSTSALALGSHTITAEYVSDSAEFANSSSSILTQFIYTPGPAFPVTFEYDTQLFSTGALTGQGTPAWSEKFLSGDDAGGTVVSGQSYGGGSQALNVWGYRTSRVTLASPVQDQWFEFAFKPNFTNGTPATTWALTTRGGAGDAWGITMGLSWDGAVGTVYVGGIGAGVTGIGTAIGSFTNGQWQTISFQTNNTAGSYNVFLGSSNTSLGTFSPAGFNGVQTLVFSSATQSWTNTGNWYVDNINVGSDSIYVLPEPDTTSHVSSSSNPQAFGSEVTFTATVTATGSSDPTGSVTFKDGGSTLGSVALTGLGGGSAEATYSTSALALGSHTITAEYVSDSAAFTNSSSTLTQFINTAGSAFPVTFEYDSQLFTPGALTEQGTPAWSELFLSGHDVGGSVVSGQSSSGGGQALQVAGYKTSRVTLASPVQDQWFEFAFKPNFTNGTPATTWALTTRGGAGDAWGIKMGLSWDGSVGTVYVGDIGAGVTPNGTAIGNFTNGEWQTISFKTNNTIGNYKVYLGGNNTSLGTFAPAGFNGVQTLVFSSATQSWLNTGNWYVDNINVGAQSVYVTGPTTVPYATWATTNAGGQAADLDWDSDGVSNGVEFFMDSAPGFTSSKELVDNTVTWPNGGNIDSADYGSKFVVQTSTDLVSWTDVPGTGDANLVKTSSSVAYTLSGSGKKFVRLKVTP